MQGKADASWAQELGVKTVFVVHDKDAYGAGLAEVFEKQCPKLGLTLVGEAIVNPDDVQPAVAQVRQANADLVYFGGNTQSGAGVVLRTMRELGVRSRFMGPDGIRETAFLDAAGATAEGTFASLGAMPVEKLPPRAKEWYDRYKQQYQGAPEPYTLYAYEATRVILAGIARAGVKDRAHIRDAIMGTHDYHGLLGTWSFTPEGDTSIRDIAGYQVHNHVFEFRQMLKSQ
jgi:branched-chain amino acid transport system substrate-binding protein